jgi:hypothetical protein
MYATFSSLGVYLSLTLHRIHTFLDGSTEFATLSLTYFGILHHDFISNVRADASPCSDDDDHIHVFSFPFLGRYSSFQVVHASRKAHDKTQMDIEETRKARILLHKNFN